MQGLALLVSLSTSFYAMPVDSVLDLSIDLWLLILDELRTKDYTSLRSTCKQLDKFIASILWEKLELWFSRKNLPCRRHYEPRHVKELKSLELTRYVGMEKDMCRVWMALDLAGLRKCVKTPNWLTARLPG